MIGMKFVVVATDVDETRHEGERPEKFVRRLAAEKALAGLATGPDGMAAIGADTIVLVDERILGKPVDRDEAMQMLSLLSGRDHLVLSAVALAVPGHGVELALNRTRVTIAPLPPEFIQWYCSTDEPLDKAGGYAIQGVLGCYVARIEGSYSGVMGLPLYETCTLLRSAGLSS